MFFPDRTSIFRGFLRSPGEGEKVGEFPRSAGGGAVATTIGSCLDLFFFPRPVPSGCNHKVKFFWNPVGCLEMALGQVWKSQFFHWDDPTDIGGA